MKAITAKYDGRCVCGWQWDAGDTIYVERGEPPICEGCGRSEEEHARKLAKQRRDGE